jgi:hypothetical protein
VIREGKVTEGYHGLTFLFELCSAFFLFSYLPYLFSHIVSSLFLLCFSSHHIPVWLHAYL